MNGHYRGLHIVVINPSNGAIDTAEVFDTYESCKLLDDFIEDEIPKGRIIVAACKDECVTKLSEKAKKWLAGMGSKKIMDLEYR